jgi:DNA repair protein RecO (recombination protein O)
MSHVDDVQTRALVLQTFPLKEQDKRFVLFSWTHGKIFGRAKGIRKLTSKLSTSLEFFTESELYLKPTRFSSEYWILQAKLISSYPELKCNLKLISSLQLIAEILMQVLPENDASIQTYQLVLKAVETLKTWGTYYQEIISSFLMHFLKQSGYSLELQYCVVCQGKNKHNQYFLDPMYGGLVGTTCEVTIKSKIVFSLQISEYLKSMQKMNIHQVHILKINLKLRYQILRVLLTYLELTIEKKLKMTEYFLNICQLP